MVPSKKMIHDPLPDRLVAGLSKIGLAMKSRAWKRPGRKGPGPLQLQVLAYLSTCPNQAATVSAIAREMAVKLPTISETIRILTEKRFVRRVQRDADRRIVKVHLTTRGAQVGKVGSGWPEILATATKQLTPQEQTSLLTMLVKLIGSLRKQGEMSVVRMCPSCQHFRPNEQKSASVPHHCMIFDASFGDQSIRLDCPEFVPAATPKASGV